MDAATRKLLEDLRDTCRGHEVPIHRTPNRMEARGMASSHANMARRIQAHLDDASSDANAAAIDQLRAYLATTVRGAHEGVPERPQDVVAAVIDAHKALRSLTVQTLELDGLASR